MNKRDRVWTAVARSEITVELVVKQTRDQVVSQINVLSRGVPQYTLGPYERSMTMAEAMQIVVVEKRIS